MPYKSKAQEKFFNANKAEMESKGVDVNEWNAASKGKSLPSKLKGEAHSYDSSRKTRPVVSRYSK